MTTEEEYATLFLKNELKDFSPDLVNLFIKHYVRLGKGMFPARNMANDIELLFRERLHQLSEKGLP
jgi:hypothetical protein